MGVGCEALGLCGSGGHEMLSDVSVGVLCGPSGMGSGVGCGISFLREGTGGAFSLHFVVCGRSGLDDGVGCRMSSLGGAYGFGIMCETGVSDFGDGVGCGASSLRTGTNGMSALVLGESGTYGLDLDAGKEGTSILGVHEGGASVLILCFSVLLISSTLSTRLKERLFAFLLDLRDPTLIKLSLGPYSLFSPD